MSNSNVITTDRAPAAIGPYSQARVHGGLLFVSGQLPIDPLTSKISSDDPAKQIKQCLTNIQAIAEVAGTSMAHCLKTTVLVTDLSRFPDINAAYGQMFTAPYPARATYQVAALPLNAQIEVEAVIAII
ncbi:reactive intermediate/imine deaminase [Metarhizobium album]|uniref:Reactive intermediate/imine deaminase n=1 Tax=Metarhizobium album TaxID=2182425 RepID=A0A2U2DJ47_9HYPH|nr:Rid family detoxifying hydrolase [Rhizobium album]PWE53344.1 reactive intermediate/imine deaminase [Rhizobium album]